MIKKIFVVLLGICSLFVISQAIGYDATDSGWVIKEFNATAEIGDDRTTKVIEEIKVDFRDLEKHGIYRYMPYEYSRNGNSYKVRIKIQNIEDKNGVSVPYEESKSFGVLNLKIGDANKTINGEQTYKISYEIDRVINNFSDHDEFYWNATGIDWPVPIEKTSMKVIWPNNAKMTDNVCYTGSFGSTAQNCSVGLSEDKKNIVNFSSDTILNPGEGMTVVSGVEKGVIKNYPFWQGMIWFFSDNWPYLIPFVVLAYMIWLYKKHGKDPSGKTTIVPEFAPPGKLAPAVMGTILDEKVDPRDISSVIIHLAVRGYIKIKENKSKGVFGSTKTDYELIDTGKAHTDFASYETKIWDGIFGSAKSVMLSDLKDVFYKHLPAIKKDLYTKVEKKYFVGNPESSRNLYRGIGITIIVLCFFLPGCLSFAIGAMMPGVIACIVSGLIIIAFSGAMAQKTSEGVETLRQIKGFKLYMETAEKYREKFNEQENIFSKYLPYAMMFGIVSKWANAFKDMQIERPDWYEGYGPGRFDPLLFAVVMNNMNTTMNHNLVSAPSSAGGGGSGFSGGGSGGGFGGGGGGSW